MPTDFSAPSRRRPGLLAVLGVCLVIACVTAYLLLRPEHTPAPDGASDSAVSSAPLEASEEATPATADPSSSAPDAATTNPPAPGGERSGEKQDDDEQGRDVDEAQAGDTPRRGPTGPMSEPVAEDTVSRALEDEAEVLDDVDAGPELPRTVTGAYAEALQARLAEFEDAGWTQVGTPVITSLELVEEHPDETPQRAVVLACVDSSDVDIVDADGNSLRNTGTPARTANLFTLVRENGTWSVADATFPEDPDC